MQAIKVASAQAGRVGNIEVAALTDADLASVRLLLTGEGAANNQQNGSFIDGSPNVAAVTLNGTVGQGTFAPYNTDGWGSINTAYAGNVTTPNALSFASNANFAIGSAANFTLEAWIYVTDFRGTFFPIFQASTNFTSTSDQIWFSARSGSIDTGKHGGGNPGNAFATTINTNTWYHVALVRNAGTTTAYLNGTAVGGTYAGFNNVSFTQAGAVVGFMTSVGSGNGYISNCRFVNGTAVYTANFTPSILPLKPITNTQVLIHGANAGVMDAVGRSTSLTLGNAKTSNIVTRYGQRSLAFDGAGDYVIIPAATVGGIGSGDFTVECWVYPNALSGTTSFIAQASQVSASSTAIFRLGSNGANLNFFFGASGQETAGGTLVPGRWQHVAVTRSGSTFRAFIDGAQVASNTSAATRATPTTPYSMGTIYSTTDTLPSGDITDFNGYLDEVKITAGVARYTAAFTPPRAPTLITRDLAFQKVVYQLDCDGANTSTSFPDTSLLGITTTATGGAQVSTAAPKFGTGAMTLNASTAFVSTEFAGRLQLPNGADWTVDMYVKRTGSTSFSALFCEAGTAAGGAYATPSTGIHNILYMDNSNGSLSFEYGTGGSQLATPYLGRCPLNTWVHVAVVYNGTAKRVRIFVGGVEVHQSIIASYTTPPTTPRYTVGAVDANFVGTKYYAAADLDRVRVTVGLQRYTKNFTPE